MKTRIIVTIFLALFLVLLVMAAAGLITYLSWMPTEKYSRQDLWQTPFPASEAMKIIDLTGDKRDDIFLQNASSLQILSQDGKSIFTRSFSTPLATSMGDVDQDQVEDVIAYSTGELTIITKNLTPSVVKINGLSAPARAAVIRFPTGPQIVLGDQSNNLLAVNREGKELWRAKINFTNVIRGLDDALVKGVVYLAAASYNGSVSLFDDQGKTRWNYSISGNLRRLRAFDLNGDGTGEILIGGDNGRLVILNADTGKEIKSTLLGQAVVEIREAELDGNPTAREFVAGGKDGGIWAFRADGSQIWSGSLSERVSAIIPMDVDGDGIEEVIFGDEGGHLYVVRGKSGEKFSLDSLGSGVTRLDVGRVTESRQLLAADGSKVYLMNIRHETASGLRYLPLLAGLLISLVIIVISWLIATNPPRPVLKTEVYDNSAESLKSQRHMLHENISDVERLKRQGEMTPDAYLARLKELREQLAANETAMKKAGLQVTIETFRCPHCGGTLPLGTDRCDYCGQTVIT